MKTFRLFLVLFLTILSASPTLCLAQSDSTQTPPGSSERGVQFQTPAEKAELEKKMNDEAAKGCAACGGSLLVVGIIFIGLIALNVALLVWVARDSKSRGMDSSILWMILVMFTGLIGLIIYFFSRPQGQLARCAKCGGNRLTVSAVCPHCRNA